MPDRLRCAVLPPWARSMGKCIFAGERSVSNAAYAAAFLTLASIVVLLHAGVDWWNGRVRPWTPEPDPATGHPLDPWLQEGELRMGKVPSTHKTLEGRNPFAPLAASAGPVPKREAAPAPPPTPPRVPLKERANGLRLVGILSVHPPQAIVEDTKNQTIHYLAEGEFIHELRLDKIGPDRIVLSFEEERMDLLL